MALTEGKPLSQDEVDGVANATALKILIALLACCASARAVDLSALPSGESRITWEVESRIKRAEGVYADPHRAGRVWVVTAPAIMESFDGGATWTALPATGRDKLGRVEDVLFSRYSSELVFLASRDNGVFRSNDSGKTWQNVGTVASGMSNATVVQLAADPGDRGSRIWYAAHGSGVPGISKTIDGGQTWFTIAEDYFVNNMLLDARDLEIGARPVKDEDTWSIVESMDGGATWTEVVPNSRPTCSSITRAIDNWIWFGTLKGRLYSRHRVGRWQTGEWEQVGPEDGEWTSVFGTFGAKPDEELNWAYDPHKYGLLCSKDGFKTWWSENAGLFVGRLVKEGAMVRPNCVGNQFYASINGELYVGRTTQPDGPQIGAFTVTPALMRWEKGAVIGLSAKVLPFDQDTKSKIKSVTVTPGLLHGTPQAVLLDDGKHDDGAASDGVFGGSITIHEDWTKPFDYGDKRQSLPGEQIFTLTATDEAGRTNSSLASFSIFAKPRSAIWWDGEKIKHGGKMADGQRVSDPSRFDEHNGNIFEMDVEARSGKHCLHIVAFTPNWITGWGSEREPYNVSDEDYLSFWIKTPKNTTRDLQVMLADSTKGESDANHSTAVWLIKDGFIKSFTTEYQQVRIPISKLMKKSGFNIDMVGGIVFSGDDPHGHNFYVDDIGFEVEGEPLN